MKLLPPICLALLLAGAAPTGLAQPAPVAKVEPGKPITPADLKPLAAALNLLREGLATPPSQEQMLQAALRGVLREADPDGAYLSPEEVKNLRERSTAQAVGVGLSLAERQQRLVVAATVEGGPAELAGVRRGDVLLALDGQSVAGLRSDTITRQLRGAAGSELQLLLQRGQEPAPRELRLQRAVLQNAGVTLRMPEPGLLLLRVPMLNDKTVQESATLLRAQWQAQPVRGMLMDLRGNPGGLLSAAMGLATMLLPKGELIGRTVGSSPDSLQEYRAEAARATADPLQGLPPALKSLPLLVLVDEGSASGAEMLAAALQEHGRARLAGHKTEGRGSIQKLQLLSERGDAIKYTSAYWETPKGKRLHGVGLQPDLPLEAATAQEELQQALALLRRQVQGGGGAASR
ncbi:S41 family peptidase [Paucibacter soli]|uniref:S41 family peptidase n=1 Tax=Paucibacter soli TaxID=3133433 RepID=UPI00309611D9